MEPTDAQLLESFLRDQDEAAFEGLVGRYAGMVLGACQRITQNVHDAEDAFQATFLVLARKAGMLRTDQPIGNWLYQVATGEALNVKTRAYKKKECAPEYELEQVADSKQETEIAWNEISPILDQELARLPAKFRWPILLCYFQGKKYEEAAAELGIAHSKLRGRLGQARDLLRYRLIRRGVTLSSTVLGTFLLGNASAQPTHALIQSTVKHVSAQMAAPVSGLLSMAQLITRIFWTMTYKYKTCTAAGIAILALSTFLFLKLHYFETQKEQKENTLHSKSSYQDSIKTSTPQPSTAIAESDVIELPTSIDDYKGRFEASRMLPDSQQRWKALRKLGIGISYKDFVEAENSKTKDPDGMADYFPHIISSYFHATIFKKWVESDGASAANWVYRLLPFASDHADGLSSFGVGFHYHQASINDQYSVGAQESLFENIFKHWMFLEPEAASEWAKPLPKGFAKDIAQQSILEFQLLTQQDPAKAFSSLIDSSSEYSEEQGQNVVYNRLVYNLVANWAEEDLEGVMKFLSTLSKDALNSTTGRGTLNAIGHNEKFRNKKIEEITAWMDLLQGGEKEAILWDYVGSWASRDLQAARKWAENNYKGDRTRILHTIAMQWAEKEPEAAARWAGQFRKGDEWDFIMSGVITSWAKKRAGKRCEVA